MSNRKATKRALLTSVMALALCVVMLVGTTFAWFTDTAKTSVNRIQAGNLDVDLEMWNGEKWVTAEGKTLSFLQKQGETQVQNAEILWEPGCTYELPELRVVNNGNLALKYKIQITGIKGDAELNEVIDWTMKVGDGDYNMATEHHLDAKVGETVDADIVTIKGHMQESAGNDYMSKTIEGIAITVVATQDTVEFDSISDRYDALAEYPVYAATPVEVDENNLLTAEAKLSTPATHEVNGETVAIAAATVPVGTKVDADAQQLELIIEKAENPDGIAVKVTQTEPKTLDISMKGLAADNDKLIKVEFYIEKGLSVLEIYHSGRPMSRCGGLKWVDVDQEFYYDTNTGLVTMLTKTFSPFTYVSDKFYWDNKKADAYATPVDTENKIITVASAEELALFKYEITDKKVNYTGYTLNITADIDLGAGYWRPIDPINGMTINGNGHTISNLLVRSCTNPSGYGYGFIGNAKGAVTIRDLTFDNANVACSSYTTYYGNVGAIVMAYAYGTTEFDNVKVINSTISGYGKIGCLLGMGADPGVKVTFKDCVSQDNTIKAVYNMGGLAGNIQRGNGADNAVVKNCTVENINVVYDSKESYVDLNGTATFKSNDKADGTDVTKNVSGKYWIYDNRYWGGYADYYVSYGGTGHTAPVDGYTMSLANSEYNVNK